MATSNAATAPTAIAPSTAGGRKSEVTATTVTRTNDRIVKSQMTPDRKGFSSWLANSAHHPLPALGETQRERRPRQVTEPAQATASAGQLPPHAILTHRARCDPCRNLAARIGADIQPLTNTSTQSTTTIYHVTLQAISPISTRAKTPGSYGLAADTISVATWHASCLSLTSPVSCLDFSRS